MRSRGRCLVTRRDTVASIAAPLIGGFLARRVSSLGIHGQTVNESSRRSSSSLIHCSIAVTGHHREVELRAMETHTVRSWEALVRAREIATPWSSMSRCWRRIPASSECRNAPYQPKPRALLTRRRNRTGTTPTAHALVRPGVSAPTRRAGAAQMRRGSMPM